MAQTDRMSPVTGILAEERVMLDFGEYEGCSILEIADTKPEYYNFLIQQKEKGNFTIRRAKDKFLRLYIQTYERKKFM